MTQNKKPTQNHPPYIPEASAPYIAQATQSAAHTAETIAKIRETCPISLRLSPSQPLHWSCQLRSSLT